MSNLSIFNSIQNCSNNPEFKDAINKMSEKDIIDYINTKFKKLKDYPDNLWTSYFNDGLYYLYDDYVKLFIGFLMLEMKDLTDIGNAEHENEAISEMFSIMRKYN